MNTIKLGKRFCYLYNNKYKTDISPKEIFCDVIAPLLFHGDEHLISWKNSKWHYVKDKINDFNETLISFCEVIETEHSDLMTSMNVFNGCANYVYTEGINPTTEFCFKENLYFNFDERYCSFIGSAFMLRSGKCELIINNDELIMDIFQSIKEYRKLLDNNNSFKGNQLGTYNSLFLYKKKIDNDFDINSNIRKVDKSNKLEFTGVDFEKILFSISKYGEINYFELTSSGNTNISYPPILLDLKYCTKIYDFINNFYNEPNKLSSFKTYREIFGGNDILYTGVQCGIIGENLFNPIITLQKFKDNKQMKKYIANYKKYFSLIMKKEELDLAKKFVEQLNLDKGLSNKTTDFDIENILKSKTKTVFNETLLVLLKKINADKNNYKDIINYLNSDITKENLTEFLTYANLIR